ncbi:hypothetical protein Salat_1590600 [Sesamum alatum]|uniref:Uncharacterized protein n=1 Tax=Sesamum alatum TaxID=300844 RepID=A0AAE1YDE8_9LAMI|nr:hypothetical protein Salat_1590600 [Sesamum alatum]
MRQNSGGNIGKSMEYFVLEDVWQCYDEWSAYGAGTPVVFNKSNSSSRRHETVVQYYAPYLSAIQLYMTNLRDDQTTTSNSILIDSSSNIDVVHDPTPTWNGNPIAYPYFQYCETISPYWRLPLVDKVYINYVQT